MNTTLFGAETLNIEQSEAIASNELTKLDDLALAFVGRSMADIEI